MATTIQDCASLSAAERRQKRKDRILAKAESRLEQLLPGDSKKVSSFEADDEPSNSFSDLETSTKTAKLMDSSMETAIGLDSSVKTAKDIDDSTSKLDTAPMFEETMNGTGEIDFVEPTYMDLIDINRVQACIFIGVLLRVLTLLHIVDSILPIWVALSVSYHLYLIKETEKKFPHHGYIVNVLLASGMNEELVRYGGFVIDTLWSFMIDTMIMTFGFLCAHVVIFAVNLMF